jgi:hypothetical protein
MNASALRAEAQNLRDAAGMLPQTVQRRLWFIARNLDDIAERVGRMEAHGVVPRSARAGFSVVSDGDTAA